MGFSSGEIQAQSRSVVNIGSNWKFQKGDFEEAFKVNFNDSKWESVTVPHDWAIYGPFDKNVDIQKVAIVQNGENSSYRKNRTNRSFTSYWNSLVPQ